MSTRLLGSGRRWTNKSVKLLAGDSDPVAAMINRAQQVTLGAMQAGWYGPPFDPFALAGYLNITVAPNTDVPDARTVSTTPQGLRIEYNPSRPRARVRYSVAHEISHTLFPDCGERVRYRQSRGDMRLDDWELETLCNVGAAELLMPIGSLPQHTADTLSIDLVLEMRARFEVSVEAVLLRIVRLTEVPCFVFACSCDEESGDHSYRIDYAVPSRSWYGTAPASLKIPRSSVVSECIAIGYTSKGDEEWQGTHGPLHIECVGIQPLPGRIRPRVVGLAILAESAPPTQPRIAFVRGDATSPRGPGSKLIVHVVNDKTPNWGGGFANALRQRWPDAQREFQEWVAENPKNLAIGNTHIARITSEVYVGHLISQKGYGPSKTPRIRYAALRSALGEAAEFAEKKGCSIHMPRIGCGQAGGSWDVVEELILEALGQRKIQVTVYDPPNSDLPKAKAPSLFS